MVVDPRSLSLLLEAKSNALLAPKQSTPLFLYLLSSTTKKGKQKSSSDLTSVDVHTYLG